MPTRRSCLLLGVVTLTLAAPVAAQPHPLAVRDLIAFDRISEPAVSPDGQLVAFTVSSLDEAAARRRTDVWVVGADGAGLRRLTDHAASDGSPTWTPDGRSVFFLSGRSGSSQVWRVAREGGEATAVTSLPLDVGAYRLSPDGQMLAVALDVFPDCDDLACTTRRLELAKKATSTGQIYDHLFVRHWDTWKDGRRSHLFAVPVAGGDAVPLMRGIDADSPSKPFGGSDEFTFTPDGRAVVFTARLAGREEPWSTNFDLHVVPVDASAAPRNLTARNPAWDTSPVFSPDGKTLAYRAMTRAGFEADRYRVVLRAWPDGEPRTLTEAWDRSPNEVVWSADGRTLFATAGNIGQQSLFAIDAQSGAAREVVRDGHVVSPSIGGNTMVAAIDHLRAPAELFAVPPGATAPRQLTRINAERLAAVQMGEPEQFSFKGWNDETVYGWVVKPVGFDPAKRYPIAFLIHGGPQGSFSNDFHYRWNPQIYAAAGYAAVMIDFHGSIGYGQAFTDSIRHDWGGKPLEDLQKGLAAALARYGWLDGDRACALGASYGGYMINWIAGNWPDGFKCLVNHDGNLDERFAYFATEELWFPEWEHGGTPWDHPEGYAKHNPIDHVAKWNTPMLVVHGGRDYRVVYTEGLATFTALQRRGIPSRFLFFPDENHWVLKPANSILWHETVLEWMARWAPAGPS